MALWMDIVAAGLAIALSPFGFFQQSEPADDAQQHAGNRHVRSGARPLFYTAEPGATAEPDRIACTGILTEAETRTSAWPLSVIHDTGGHYICTIERSTGGNQLKTCAVGEKCRVIGTFHKSWADRTRSRKSSQ